MSIPLSAIEHALKRAGFRAEVRGLTVVGEMQVLGAVIRVGVTTVSNVDKATVERLEYIAASNELDVLIVVVPDGTRVPVEKPGRCKFVYSSRVLEEVQRFLEVSTAVPESLCLYVPPPISFVRVYYGVEPVVSVDTIVEKVATKGVEVVDRFVILYPFVTVEYRIVRTQRSLRSSRTIERKRKISYDGITGEPVLYNPKTGIDYSLAVVPKLGRQAVEVLEEVMRASGSVESIARRLLADAKEVRRILEEFERAGLVVKDGGVYRAKIELMPLTALLQPKSVELEGYMIQSRAEPQHIYPAELEVRREVMYYPYALILGVQNEKRVVTLVDMVTGRARMDVLRRLRQAKGISGATPSSKT